MSLLGCTSVGTALLLALSLAFGFYERAGWEGEIAARAGDAQKAEAAVLAAQQADAAKTRQFEDEHAAEVAALKEQTNVRNLAIARSPLTDACVGSPAMRALFDGLRARPATAGAGRANAAGGTGAAVP